ncbi:MAG: helix-turn-helix domain-containing protein [Hyphomonadaceae bacterium]|nr:helix-turn-helix domain-containing protein [Hyphomonadaceae bacterium]
MAHSPSLEPLLTVKQAAGYLSLSKSRLDRWRSYGGGPPYIRLGGIAGGAIRYRQSDLARWVDANMIAGDVEPSEVGR